MLCGIRADVFCDRFDYYFFPYCIIFPTLLSWIAANNWHLYTLINITALTWKRKDSPVLKPIYKNYPQASSNLVGLKSSLTIAVRFIYYRRENLYLRWEISFLSPLIATGVRARDEEAKLSLYFHLSPHALNHDESRKIFYDRLLFGILRIMKLLPRWSTVRDHRRWTFSLVHAAEKLRTWRIVGRFMGWIIWY